MPPFDKETMLLSKQLIPNQGLDILSYISVCLDILVVQERVCLDMFMNV